MTWPNFITMQVNGYFAWSSLCKYGSVLISRWSDILLALIIFAVAFLLFLPLVPYLLKANVDADDKLSVVNLLSIPPLAPHSMSCIPQSYTGFVCRSELQNWQSYLFERQNDSDVLVPSDVDQKLMEEQVQMVFAKLQLLTRSEKCQKELKSFWCLLLFGVCDVRGQRELPSYEQCVQLYNSTCNDVASEIYKKDIISSLLLDCANLNINLSYDLSSHERSMICSDQFYFDNNSLHCKPECGVWTILSKDDRILWRMIFNTADVVVFLSCVIVLTLAVINRKRIFTFPTVLMIYQTLIVLVNCFVTAPHNMLQGSVLCTSQDLIENLLPHNSSLYCQFSGAFFLYSVLVTAFLWLFHSTTFFWGVIWPYHYSVTRNSGKMKYYHISAVTASLLIPVIVVVAVQFSGGYGISIIIIGKCGPTKLEDLFYGFLLPIDAITIIGCTLLLITGWRIADIRKRCSRKVSMYRVKISEVKILLLILYYFLLTIFHLSTTSKVFLGHYEYETILENHFMCEAQGKQTECSRDNFSQIQSDVYAHSSSLLLISLLPCGFIVFLLDYTTLRKLCHSSAGNHAARQTNGHVMSLHQPKPLTSGSKHVNNQ